MFNINRESTRRRHQQFFDSFEEEPFFSFSKRSPFSHTTRQVEFLSFEYQVESNKLKLSELCARFRKRQLAYAGFQSNFPSFVPKITEM